MQPYGWDELYVDGPDRSGLVNDDISGWTSTLRVILRHETLSVANVVCSLVSRGSLLLGYGFCYLDRRNSYVHAHQEAMRQSEIVLILSRFQILYYIPYRHGVV